MKFLSLPLAILVALLPAVASAQQVSLGAQQVAGPLVGFFTPSTGVIGLNDLAYLLMTKAWMLIGIAATYNIVRAGIKLINSQEEDKLSKARRTIGMSLVSVMAFYMVPQIVRAIYTAGGPGGVFSSPAGVTAGASIFAQELYGVIRWVLTMIIPLAIGLIVFAGIKAIASFGKEDGPAALRKEVFAVAVGLVLLVTNVAIKRTLGIPDFGLPFGPSTAPLIARGIGIVNQLLLFLALAATIVVVYAGVRVVLSFGSEEQFTQSKTLLARAVIGLAVIFISWALVSLAINLVIGSVP